MIKVRAIFRLFLYLEEIPFHSTLAWTSVKGLIVCKNRIKYRTDVAISAENTKYVGRSARKICGFEIHAVL